MKKDELCHPENRWLRPKLFMVMKLCVLFVFVFSLGLSARSVAQQEKVSLTMKEVSVQELFNQIQQQTKLYFLFNHEQVEQLGKISVDVKNETVESVLNSVFSSTTLTYSFKGNMIVVRKKEDQQAAKNQQVKGIRISGVVIDATNQPLPGVSVMVKGSKFGVATDKEGKYKIEIPEMPGVVLVFSFVGMETKEVNYIGKNTIDVVLNDDVKQIDEVVVTGYQTVKKRSMAGSVSSVKAEDLVLNGTQTLEQALQGQLPGVMVINKSGLTGTRQKVRVRGTATLLGNAEPVWVVDGVIQEDPLPFSAAQLTDIGGDNMDMIKNFVGGAIAWLNPSDIENISVLKDASATAIYGVKAANGVIVINTKKGEKGRMAVSYSGNFSVSSKMNYNKLELMNSKERVAVSREAYEKGCLLKEESPIGYMALALAYKRREISYEEFTSQVARLETTNTDWFDILFRTPFSHSHSLSISGGGDKTTYRASFGVTKNNNTAIGNDQENYYGNLNVSSVFWDKLTVTLGLSGNYAKTNAFAGTDPYAYASTTNRAIPCYNEDGSLYYYPINYNNLDYNILNEIENSGNTNNTSSVNSNLNLRWVMGKGFTYSMTLGYNFANSFGESWYGETTNYIAGKRGYNYGQFGPGDHDFLTSSLPYGGELNVTESRNNNYTWRNQLEFARTFGLHSLTAMFGQETRSNQYNGYAQTKYGYLPDRGKTFANVPIVVGGEQNLPGKYVRTNPTITDRTANYISYYGNVNYMFDERYAVNASVRMDASNRFGQDKSARYQPVWSTGVRWNVTKEHWLEGQEILNDISFRASFGYQGNVAENIGPDLICKMNAIDETTGEYSLTVSQLPTPKLRWEKNKSLNLGFDFSILHSKINGSFEYFYKKTVDMITTRKIPYANGITSMPVNGGDMTNSGWDLNFSLVPIRTKNFVWTLGMNTSKVFNKIKSELEPTGEWKEAASGELNKQGYPVSSFWAFRFKGLNPENGAPTFDLAGTELGEALDDATLYMVHAGKFEPDFTAGLNTSFRYKTLTLSANFYLSTGNQKFLTNPYPEDTKLPGEYQNMSSELLNRWQKPGDVTDIPALPHPLNSAPLFPFAAKQYSDLYPYEMWPFSDSRVVDAWYLRCSGITLSYNVPEKYISRFAQGASCSFSMSNPFQLVSKDFHGRDPEVAMGSQPMSRNYTFSVSVSF